MKLRQNLRISPFTLHSLLFLIFLSVLLYFNDFDNNISHAQESSPRQITTKRPGDHWDLTVAYIERIPKYERYKVSYLKDQSDGKYPFKEDKGPQILNPDAQHNPKTGEKVTFFAHILNQGGKKSQKVNYTWKIDGKTLDSGTVEPLEGGKETVKKLEWKWQEGVHNISFSIDAKDFSTKNNSLEDRIDGYFLQVLIDKPLYDRFAQKKNLTGTYSFEDWLKAQTHEMKKMFKLAVYDITPEGVKAGFRIDKILIVDKDKDFSRDYRFDGEWRFRDVSGWPDCQINKIDYGLLHEWGHQLGLPDLYQMNLVWERNLIKDANGNPYLKEIMQSPDGLMGGGSILPHQSDRPYFSSHSAFALNLGMGHRCGFFGDYVWDTPKTTRIKVLDSKGNPLQNATVSFHPFNTDTQKGKEKIGMAVFFMESPLWTLKTDKNGIITLPNQTVPEKLATYRGHKLKNNPFGDLDVGTNNGVFVLKIVSNRQVYLTALYVWQLNIEFWKGNRDTATILIKTRIGDSKTGWEPRQTKADAKDKSAVITFDSIVHAESYTLYYGTKPNPTQYAQGVWAKSPIEIKGLTPKTRYYYQITANAGNEIHPVAYQGSFTTK